MSMTNHLSEASSQKEPPTILPNPLIHRETYSMKEREQIRLENKEGRRNNFPSNSEFDISHTMGDSLFTTTFALGGVVIFVPMGLPDSFASLGSSSRRDTEPQSTEMR